MTIGALWAFFTAHKHAWWQIILGILLFASGWQLGRVMSPYYASHPIVFEDRECRECASSGGTAAELEQLLQEGIALRAPEPEVAGSAHIEKALHQEGSHSVSPKSPTESDSAVAGKYVGSVNSDKYHAVPECSTWKQIKENNQVWFSSIEEAELAGYVPTKCTSDLIETSN